MEVGGKMGWRLIPFCRFSLQCLLSSHRGTEIAIHPDDEMPWLPSRPKASRKLCLLLGLFEVNLLLCQVPLTGLSRLWGKGVLVPAAFEDRMGPWLIHRDKALLN